MSGGEVEQALLDAVRLRPEEDVLVLGGGSLALGAHELVGDGWVYVVRSQVDELEALLGEAHAVGASGVAYLVGETPVLPPGGAFEYTSYCPLKTAVGTMQGTYQMVTANGEQFDAVIAPFTLAVPNALN
jgi:hypothetical protein